MTHRLLAAHSTTRAQHCGGGAHSTRIPKTTYMIYNLQHGAAQRRACCGGTRLAEVVLGAAYEAGQRIRDCGHHVRDAWRRGWQHLELLRGKVVAKEFHDQIMNKTKQPVGGGSAVTPHPHARARTQERLARTLP